MPEPHLQADLLQTMQRRDWCLLLLLDSHRYLATDQVAGLLFPSPSGLTAAQRRLRLLARRGLIVSVGRRRATGRGVVHFPAVHMLSQAGSSMLADWRGVDRKPIADRSLNAARTSARQDHDLEVNAFFVSLAVFSRSLADQGLYVWIGDDSMRRLIQARGGSVAPDGYGRYLLGEREIAFCLELDRDTEPIRAFRDKMTGYVGLQTARRNRTTVLVVVPSRRREEAMRQAVRDVLPPTDVVRPYTATTERIEEVGPLGTAWQPIGGRELLSLAQLPFIPRQPDSSVADCIGKPGWWERRLAVGD